MNESKVMVDILIFLDFWLNAYGFIFYIGFIATKKYG